MEARKLGDLPPPLPPGAGETLGLGGARLDMLRESEGLQVDVESGWLESSDTFRGACNDV